MIFKAKVNLFSDYNVNKVRDKIKKSLVHGNVFESLSFQHLNNAERQNTGNGFFVKKKTFNKFGLSYLVHRHFERMKCCPPAAWC